jgi:hypothetical protein
VAGGRVVGTWQVAEGSVRVQLFAEAPRLDDDAIRAEAAHLNPGAPVKITRR